MLTLKDKFRGCLYGMAVGDSMGSKAVGVMGEDSQLAMCVADALCKSSGSVSSFETSLCENLGKWFASRADSPSGLPSSGVLVAAENLMNGFPPSQAASQECVDSSTAARAAPIGLYWNDITTKAVQFGISGSEVTHGHELAKCSSASVAMGCLLAARGVPVGCWANEMFVITNGISTCFVDSLKDAALRAASLRESLEDLAAIGSGWTGNEAVAKALYCCMSYPYDFSGAVKLALCGEGNTAGVAAITGAWMGARLGIGAIPTDWASDLQESADIGAMADSLYEAFLKRKKDINEYQLIYN